MMKGNEVAYVLNTSLRAFIMSHDVKPLFRHVYVAFYCINMCSCQPVVIFSHSLEGPGLVATRLRLIHFLLLFDIG